MTAYTDTDYSRYPGLDRRGRPLRPSAPADAPTYQAQPGERGPERERAPWCSSMQLGSDHASPKRGDLPHERESGSTGERTDSIRAHLLAEIRRRLEPTSETSLIAMAATLRTTPASVRAALHALQSAGKIRKREILPVAWSRPMTLWHLTGRRWPSLPAGAVERCLSPARKASES